MSAVRIYVDGRPTWRKADDGATPYRPTDWSRAELVVGEPDYAETHRRYVREHKRDKRDVA